MSHLVNYLLCPNYEDYQDYGQTSCMLKHWPDMWDPERQAEHGVYEERQKMKDWLLLHPRDPDRDRKELQKLALSQLCEESGWQVAHVLEDKRIIYKIFPEDWKGWQKKEENEEDMGKLSWRCKTIQQQRDKQVICNNKEWRRTRARKLRVNPLCELCESRGKVVAAHCVHHIVPIETAHTLEEMQDLAFDWNNLQSLCDQCHADVHKQAGSHTKEAHKQREEERHQRWVERQRRPRQ